LYNVRWLEVKTLIALVGRGDVVRDALRRQLTLPRFDQVRQKVLPFAEAGGYLTDEDVARDVS
jgi:hypothetical protein